MQDFLSAARAKRLDRVAAAYAVAGWLLVQAASIVLPTFGTPAWALRSIIAIAFIGFPVALFVAWFSIPHPHPETIPKQTSLTPGEYMLIGLLGGVLLLSLAQIGYQFVTRSLATSNTVQSSPSPGATPPESNAETTAVKPPDRLSEGEESTFSDAFQADAERDPAEASARNLTQPPSDAGA